ncbi:hypothetical protein H5999_00395 [[Clostridium] spiroforme]|nr:hypothetical protein [Thomasclavelia spiroformis]
MNQHQREKFIKFLYFVFFFAGSGVSIATSLPMFFYLAVILGNLFLLKKVNYKEMSKAFLFTVIVVLPIVAGVITSLLFQFLETLF